MPRHSSLASAATVAVLAATLAGCSQSVSVTPPTPEPTAAAACADLSARLPATLADQAPRATSPQTPFAAAWGSPPILLTCGVGVPSQLTPSSQLVGVDDVEWLPVKLSAGYRFVTVGRVANVQVDVPDDYAPEASVLTELAAPVKDTIATSVK